MSYVEEIKELDRMKEGHSFLYHSGFAHALRLGVEIAKRADKEISELKSGNDAYFLRELLAVIHGDGGHYQEEHGTKAAVNEACAKLYKLKEAPLDYETWQEATAVDEVKNSHSNRRLLDLCDLLADAVEVAMTKYDDSIVDTGHDKAVQYLKGRLEETFEKLRGV